MPQKKKAGKKQNGAADSESAAGSALLANQFSTEAVHHVEHADNNDDSRPASMAMSIGDETSVAPMSSRSSLGLNPSTHIILSSKIHGRGEPRVCMFR